MAKWPTVVNFFGFAFLLRFLTVTCHRSKSSDFE